MSEIEFYMAAVARLREALRVYADPGNWRVVYGGTPDRELRVWAGPGEGPVLAMRALEDKRALEDRRETPSPALPGEHGSLKGEEAGGG